MKWTDTYLGVVQTWTCDHFGHMNVRFYAHIFDDAGFVFWSLSGITREMFAKEGVHTVVARTETNMVRELLAGQTVRVRSRWVELGKKSVTYEQEILDAETQEIHATQRVVEVFFEPTSRTSHPIPDSIRARLSEMI